MTVILILPMRPLVSKENTRKLTLKTLRPPPNQWRISRTRRYNTQCKTGNILPTNQHAMAKGTNCPDVHENEMVNNITTSGFRTTGSPLPIIALCKDYAAFTKIRQQVAAALPPPDDTLLLDLKPGDCGHKELQEKEMVNSEVGILFQIMLTTHTTIQIAERACGSTSATIECLLRPQRTLLVGQNDTCQRHSQVNAKCCLSCSYTTSFLLPVR